MKRRYVIVDRDGTLNVERHYLCDPEGLELLPGVVEGLKCLRDLGLGLVVVTNQSGVGRGYFDLDRLAEIHARLESVLRNEGITLDGIYVCPHTAEENCPCRKPRAGLVERAADDLQFDLRQSFVIGDQARDILMGKSVGALTILVTTDCGMRTHEDAQARPDFTASNLLEAAQVIARLLSGEAADGGTL